MNLDLEWNKSSWNFNAYIQNKTISLQDYAIKIGSQAPKKKKKKEIAKYVTKTLFR